MSQTFPSTTAVLQGKRELEGPRDWFPRKNEGDKFSDWMAYKIHLEPQ
jgi:hypothetical protein